MKVRNIHFDGRYCFKMLMSDGGELGFVVNELPEKLGVGTVISEEQSIASIPILSLTFEKTRSITNLIGCLQDMERAHTIYSLNFEKLFNYNGISLEA